jgi:hypothetical protein
MSLNWTSSPPPPSTPPPPTLCILLDNLCQSSRFSAADLYSWAPSSKFRLLPRDYSWGNSPGNSPLVQATRFSISPIITFSSRMPLTACQTLLCLRHTDSSGFKTIQSSRLTVLGSPKSYNFVAFRVACHCLSACRFIAATFALRFSRHKKHPHACCSPFRGWYLRLILGDSSE